MAKAIPALSVVLILCFFGKGLCDFNCFTEIQVSQDPTGQQVEGKPEYKVSLTNLCDCLIWNVNLKCPGFTTVEPIDESILSVDGDTCIYKPQLIKDVPGEFKYASDVMVDFKAGGSSIQC